MKNCQKIFNNVTVILLGNYKAEISMHVVINYQYEYKCVLIVYILRRSKINKERNKIK